MHPQAQLFHFIQERYEVTARTVASEPQAPFQLPDPYLLASAVQKAVRRGDLNTARRAAHQLHALEQQRLWRRLAVIALEDIGIADIEVAAELVAVVTIPSARRLMGDDLTALDTLLSAACRAVKDRTGDHFCSIVDREPVTAEDRALLGQASPNALLAIVTSSSQHWVRRLRAAVMFSGRADGQPNHPGKLQALFEVYGELGVPELLIAACAAYARRQRDALPVFVPLAWLLRGRTSPPGVTVPALSEADMVGDMPAYAFDPVNCRLGRRAVDLFLKAHITKPAYSPRLVAAAIWNAESALCDQTLDWPLSQEIRRCAYMADLACRGLPPDQHATLNAWIARERPALIAARQAVWNRAVREAGKPAGGPEQATLPLPVPERRPRRG